MTAQTDRELLELAAKAAGLNAAMWVPQSGNLGDLLLLTHGVEGHTFWNPLTDDGDALRLAVALALLVLTARGFAVVNARDSGGGVVRIKIEDGDDPNAATRRAIVRAAAAIAENPHG